MAAGHLVALRKTTGQGREPNHVYNILEAAIVRLGRMQLDRNKGPHTHTVPAAIGGVSAGG